MIDYAAAREAMVDRQVRPSDVTRYPIIAAMLAVPREEFLPAAVATGGLSRRARSAGAGAGAPRPPRVRQASRRAGRRAEGSGARPRLRPRLLDRGAGADGRGGGGARIRPRDGSRGRGAAGAHAVDNAVVHAGPLADGVAEHGPFDAILVEGAIEVLPDAIADQLKPGGRIAAIFADGAGGQARLGLRTRKGHRLAPDFRCDGPHLARLRDDESI